MEPIEDRRDRLMSLTDKLVPVGLTVFVLLLILNAALPNYVNRRDRRVDQRNGCINNLRQIDGAKCQWALENKAPSNAIPTWENIKRYLGRGPEGTILKCPQGGIYTIGSLTNNPTCSIKGHALE